MKTLWKSMIQRCHNPRNPSYHRYGGRGILVCDRWRQSFAAFVADVGPRPAGATLDRIDNDRGYEPGNVRWATRREQSANRFDSISLTHAGETLNLAEWSRRTRIDHGTIYARIRNGWSVARALTEAPDRRFTREQGSKRTHGVPKENSLGTPGGVSR